MRTSRKIILLLAVLILVIGILAVFYGGHRTAYYELKKDGYAGTREQFLAALVAELCMEAPIPENQTAFSHARRLGYCGSEAEWIRTVTGADLDSGMQAMYMIAMRSGYENGLEAWLESLVSDPGTLGASGDPAVPTEYELACRYGFEGTFVQWLVVLAGIAE